MRQVGFLCLVSIFALLTVTSQNGGAPPDGIDAQPTYRAPTVVSNMAAAAPTAAPTADLVHDDVMIWWPAPLYPEQGSAAEATLKRQVEQAKPLSITIRVKKSDGVGGIFETLRTASAVAPSVMPDLALMRYSQIASAAGLRLLQNIDLKSVSVDDLFKSSLILGRLQGVQVAVPYVLELQHTVYRSAAIPTAPRSLVELAASGQPFLFPARATKGVNATLLYQYVAAGGRFANNDGSDILDRAPLLGVLGYYEQAVKANLIGPALLGYSTAAQYWVQFMAGRANIIEMDSSMYLIQRAAGMPLTGPSAVSVSALPAPSDKAYTMVDGWLWVMTATEPNRKARALQAMAWLMEPTRLGEFSRVTGTLPARRAALDTWRGDEYATFARAELDKDAALLPDMVKASLADLLQSAFEDVLNGRKPAESAVDDAIRKIKPN